MKILLSYKELCKRGIWEDYQDLVGMNPWACKDGQVGEDEVFHLSAKEAYKLGLLSEKEEQYIRGTT